MGQSSTEATLCVHTGVSPSYTKPKGKKWETLTLKNRPRTNQTKNKQAHFKSSVDFSINNKVGGEPLAQDVSFDAIPVLTAAVSPVATTNVVANDMAYDSIPVLDKPFTTPNNPKQKTNPFLMVTTLLLVCGTGLMLFGETSQEDRFTESLAFTANNNNVEIAIDSGLSSGTANEVISGTDNTVSVSRSDILLIQNIVGLLNNERFSQDTTIEAFLTVWSQLNASTKATLNNTPWFLRFVFSLQKQSRTYLQSPTSYDANYNIKLNGLLKLAIAVGVMDQRGIQSRAEIYSSKQNALVELLKSEIEQIESATKQQQPGKETIAHLNESFRARYALKPVKTVTTEAVNSKAEIKKSSKVTVKKDKLTDPITSKVSPKQESKTIKADTGSTVSASAIELDSLITRFVTAYEHGDLNMLISLFSPTAKTNDKNNVNGIRQDYKELFEASSFRLLNLMNMRWSASHDSMKGTGDYEIQIAMDEAGNARTLHGKIQFVVGKVNKQLRITRLYHLER